MLKQPHHPMRPYFQTGNNRRFTGQLQDHKFARNRLDNMTVTPISQERSPVVQMHDSPKITIDITGAFRLTTGIWRAEKKASEDHK